MFLPWLTPLESFDKSQIKSAIETATTTAESRLRAKHAVAAGIWKLIADALGARLIAMNFRQCEIACNIDPTLKVAQLFVFVRKDLNLVGSRFAR